MPKKNKAKISNTVKVFLKIVDSSNFQSAFFSALLFICYFSQTFSYIFKFQWEFEDNKLNFLAMCLFYSNFSNLMIFLQSPSLVFAVYFFAVVYSFYFYCYILMIMVLKSKIQKNFILIKIFNIFDKIYAYSLKILFWILLLPILEILINPLSCGKASSYLTCENSYAVPFLIISIICCFFVIFICFAYLMIHQNNNFLELYEIKFKSNLLNMAIYAMRVSLPVISPFLSIDSQIIIYILVFLIALFSFYEYFRNFYIRSRFLNNFYIICLMALISLIFTMTISTFSTMLIEESVFSIVFIIGIIFIKLSFNIYLKKYYKTISNNMSIDGTMDFVLGELLLLFENHKTCVQDHFLFEGILKSHTKNCTNPKCKFKIKHMKNWENTSGSDKKERIISFIIQKLSQEIIKEKKNNRTKQTQILIFKYISLLADSGVNFSHAYYEIQKILVSIPQKSYFFKIFLKLQIKKIHLRIKEIEKEQKLIQNKYEDDKSMNTTAFFKINKYKISLEKNVKKLLQAKISFWDHYKEGYNSYEEIISDLFTLMKKTFRLRQKIERSISETNKDNIVSLKFLSLFSCIIFNHLHSANKVEDEIENIKKRYIRIRRDCLTPLSFLEENLVTCEASFLNHDGLILEKSKTEKLAQFFGYDRQEIKLLKSINEFMPHILADKHFGFFQWGLRKTHKEQVNSRRQIESYSINKHNYVFPVKIYLGHSLQYANDFVMHAAIMKIHSNDVETILFEKNGLIISLSQNFFDLLNEFYSKITLKSLELINIFSLVPKLREILESNQVFETQENSLILRNLNANLFFPPNLLEIIEVLKFKREELEREKHYQSSFVSSNRSAYKSFESSRSKMTMNSKRSEKSVHMATKIKSFFSRYNRTYANGSLNTKRDFLEKILDGDTDRFNEKVINGLLCEEKLKRRRINFDITLKTYRYGKLNEDCITVGWLKVNNVGNIEDNIVVKNEEAVSDSEISPKIVALPPNNEFKFDKEFEREHVLSQLSSNNEKIEEDKLTNKINTQPEKEKNNELLENFLSLKIEPNEEKNEKEKEEKKTQSLFNPKLTNTIEINSKSKISNSSSKSKEREKIKLENLNGKTTDIGNMLLNLEAASQKASSVSSLKKSYAIFNTIKLIQEKLPKSIFLIIYTLIFQIILIFSYCIIIYFFATNYIINTYQPLQDISINQCRTNIGIDIGGLILNEYEYSALNYSTITEFQKNELERVLNITFNDARSLFYEDRNREYSFGFGNYLQTLYTNYADYMDPSKIQTILLSDMTDIFLQNLNTVLNIANYDDANDILKNIFRNFPYYGDTTKSLRDMIQADFLSSIDITSNNVVLLMALMMSIITAIKLFELFIFSSYYTKITKLVNIFLRISAKEAVNELTLNKEILNILENPALSYLHVYYPDRCLNKKEINFDEAELENLTKKKKKALKEKQVKSKKISLYNLRNLSKARVYIFISFTLIIGVGYFFSNYYFWTLSASNVSNLLQINTMFNNLYIFSTTALNYQRFLIREKILIDEQYNSNPDYYQNHQNRLKYFSSAFFDRIDRLNDFTRQLPQYALKAQSVIQDPLYDNLLSGDACLTLQAFEIIFDEQLELCHNLFNAAFSKGILSVLNEFTTNLTTNEFSIVLDNNDIAAISYEKTRILLYLRELSHINVVIGDYYLSEMLYIFYNYLKNYYSGILEQQVLNLQTFVWITCVFFSLLMGVIAFFSWKYLTSVYIHLAWSMAFIPYDKLANDEQTNFLIKQYWKEQN